MEGTQNTDNEREEMLQKLKADLKGKKKEAAKHAGISPITVRRLLNGEYYNHDRILKLIEFRNSLQKKAVEQVKELKTAMK